jgi:hypothetical protein
MDGQTGGVDGNDDACLTARLWALMTRPAIGWLDTVGPTEQPSDMAT